MDDKNKNSGPDENISRDSLLIPAIIQDLSTGEVLMLAYMNRQSLKKSMETGFTWFWSRERQKLWNKGETSGNYQAIKKIFYDCDKDALLIKVVQTGPACHTGEKSCFFTEMKYSGSEEALEECLEEKNLDFSKYCNSIEVKDKNNSNAPDFFEELYKTVHERILLKTANSYTYKLHLDGLDKIIKKFGEESIEVILAAKHQDRKNLIYEIADLFYHLTVLMVEKDISYNEIISELESRKK